ncbi:MAG: hypothetical protein A4E19_11430 [Nitrospira sp. SG-bin1]|nr:MAG: hypothetical protein A4E19_11430 [Nitrospira sp. SG-bin1]
MKISPPLVFLQLILAIFTPDLKMAISSDCQFMEDFLNPPTVLPPADLPSENNPGTSLPTETVLGEVLSVDVVKGTIHLKLMRLKTVNRAGSLFLAGMNPTTITFVTSSVRPLNVVTLYISADIGRWKALRPGDVAVILVNEETTPENHYGTGRKIVLDVRILTPGHLTSCLQAKGLGIFDED